MVQESVMESVNALALISCLTQSLGVRPLASPGEQGIGYVSGKLQTMEMTIERKQWVLANVTMESVEARVGH